MAAPKVGDLATLHYPSDSYPYIVISVSANGYKVGLERLNPMPPTPGSRTPYDRPGDPNGRTGIIDYAYRAANGRYYVAGSSPISFGVARYYQAPEV
jgi:hypothetical protein